MTQERDKGGEGERESSVQRRGRESQRRKREEKEDKLNEIKSPQRVTILLSDTVELNRSGCEVHEPDNSTARMVRTYTLSSKFLPLESAGPPRLNYRPCSPFRPNGGGQPGRPDPTPLGLLPWDGWRGGRKRQRWRWRCSTRRPCPCPLPTLTDCVLFHLTMWSFLLVCLLYLRCRLIRWVRPTCKYIMF